MKVLALRGLVDLAGMGTLVDGFLARIVHQLRQRFLVDHVETVGELHVGIAVGGETGTISLAKRADQGVAVLAADLTVLVAVAIIEAGLLHRG